MARARASESTRAPGALIGPSGAPAGAIREVEQLPAASSVRRWLRPSFGCLVRAPLGCLSFFVGAGIVVVFLLPALVGELAGPAWEDEFARRHEGTLNFGSFRLAWFGRQRVETMMLKDPDDRYVASADLELPPLSDCIADLLDRRLGPLVLDLGAELVQDEAGTLNLSRALSPKTLAQDAQRELHTGVSASGVQFLIDVGSWRISWTTPRMLAERREVSLSLDKGRLTVGDSGAGSFEGGGFVEWSQDAGAAPVKGRGPLTLSFAFEDLSAVLASKEAPRAYSWTLDALDAPLLAVLGPSNLPYDKAFGERVGSVRVERPSMADDYLEIEVRSEPANVALCGWIREGAFVGELGRRDGGEVAPTRAAFALSGFWSDEVVARLLPFVGRLAPEDSAAIASLELHAFSLPLDGDLARLRADLTLHVGDAGFAFLPRRAGDEGWSGVATDGAVKLAPLPLSVAGGKVIYRELPLELGRGATVVVSGEYDLVKDELALRARVPASVAARLPGLEVAADGVGEEVLVTGKREAPAWKQVSEVAPAPAETPAPDKEEDAEGDAPEDARAGESEDG